MIISCSVGRDLRRDTAGRTIPRQIATLIAVGLTCLVAVGCTAQFKRMPNRPLELAFDEEPSDVVAETQEPVTLANTLRHEDEAPRETVPEERADGQAETPVKLPVELKLVKDLPPGSANQTPQVYAFDVFLTLNDPDLVGSSANRVRTASLTEEDRPARDATNQIIQVAIGKKPVTPSAKPKPLTQAMASPIPKKSPAVKNVLRNKHHAVKVTHAQAVVEVPNNLHATASQMDQQAEKPINAVGVDIEPPPGVFPKDRASSLFTGHPEIRFDTPAAEDADIVYVWQSGAFCHRPLYFEQPNVERYGNSIGPLQSALSGAHFFANVVALPYWTIVEHPRACCYYEDYGVDCVGPRQRVLPPAHLGAALTEAAAVTGLILLIP